MDVSTVLGWMAIGAAAALAGMIWPFRRGPAGVVINLVAGITGAVAAALLSYFFLPTVGLHDAATRLFIAALGALSALGLVHALWRNRAMRTTAWR